VRNGRIPAAINDIVLKALQPDVTKRYQRASELLDDTLAARNAPARGTPRRTRSPATAPAAAEATVSEIQSRLRARDTPQPRFCWHCRKPLHARTDRCPFCGESQ
jgi:hypothetical protein